MSSIHSDFNCLTLCRGGWCSFRRVSRTRRSTRSCLRCRPCLSWAWPIAQPCCLRSALPGSEYRLTAETRRGQHCCLNCSPRVMYRTTCVEAREAVALWYPSNARLYVMACDIRMNGKASEQPRSGADVSSRLRTAFFSGIVRKAQEEGVFNVSVSRACVSGCHQIHPCYPCKRANAAA